MEHEYWEEQLHGFLDNELDPADRVTVQEHIDGCPDCRHHLAYFSSMKQRLRVHSESVTMPKTVATRINRLFQRKRNISKKIWFSGIGLGLAAALVIGIIFPQIALQNYRFIDCMLNGEFVCYGCEVAERAGLNKGDLCSGTHALGLLTQKGKLWRFATDEKGFVLVQDLSLVGQNVEIDAQALYPEHLLRIKHWRKVIDHRASFQH